MSANSLNFALSLNQNIMNRRFWQAFTALREHSCVGYAKLASIRGLSSVDLIVVKATTPDDLPLPDRYVRQLLSIFSTSQPSSRAFFLSFTRRFGTTRSWRVALKCLLLLHRLLRSVPENSWFRAELIWRRKNGLISLHPCRFRDYSSFYPYDYTSFIISYARFLDETISYFFLDYIAEKHNHEETKDVNGSMVDVMKEVGESIELLPQIQSLIDRVMDCRPVGLAARSFIVKSSMKHIIRESFHCHTRFHKDIVPVLDNLLRMPDRSSIAAFDIYKKAATQESQLSEFYDWCKTKRVCGSYEYPLLNRIPQMQVRSLQVLLAGMWQFSESSSENMFSSSKSSQLSLTDDEDRDRFVTQMETITSTKWEIFEDSEFQIKLGEEEDLIQLEVSKDMEWEALLEASANSSYHARNLSTCEEHGYNEAMKLQFYDPYSLNPFNQPCYMLDFDYHNTISAQIEKPQCDIIKE